MNAQQVADIFVQQRVLHASEADDVLQETQLNGKDIGRALIDAGFVDQHEFYRVIADALGTDFVELPQDEIAPEILRLIPGGLARLHRALPVALSDHSLSVALVDPLDLRAAEDLRFALGKDVRLVVAACDEVAERIERYYGVESSSTEEILNELRDLPGTASNRSGAANAAAEANAAPIIRLVDLILSEAIKDRASDIHLEPFETEFKIRYRVDGTLYEIAPPPGDLALPIISRVKVMANLNIAERRLPQDGRLQMNVSGRNVDLRVSTLPTQFGESVVLRVLDRAVLNLDLQALGLPGFIHDYLLEIIRRPNGIFIVTGPTGSGKTTTLYSCLRKINTLDSKLLTAEDPIEYDLEGIVQVPVNEAIGLSFAKTLRAFLRQDPDRIMVGETRDLETAQISIQAALTGHLVITTLHTNDAPGAVTRLIDMGVEPFLLSSTLAAVLAQRLVRSICPHCRTSYQPRAALLDELGLSRRQLDSQRFYYGKGCDACNQTGYKGRKGIFELLKISDPLRELINERAPTVILKEKAIELGMITLREDGLRSIFAGDTTIDEVLKYT